MDDIIIRVLNGQAEPIEELRVDNWRAESSENEQHFREVSAIWDWTGTGTVANATDTGANATDTVANDAHPGSNRSESVTSPPTLEAIVRRCRRR